MEQRSLYGTVSTKDAGAHPRSAPSAVLRSEQHKGNEPGLSAQQQLILQPCKPLPALI